VQPAGELRGPDGTAGVKRAARGDLEPALMAVEDAEPAVHLLVDLIGLVPGEALRQGVLVLAEVEELGERPGEAFTRLQVENMAAGVGCDLVPGVAEGTRVGVGVVGEPAGVGAVAPEAAVTQVLLAAPQRLGRRQPGRRGVVADGVCLPGLDGVAAAVAAVKRLQFTAEDAAGVEGYDVRQAGAVRFRDVAEEDARTGRRPQVVPDGAVDLVEVGLAAV